MLSSPTPVGCHACHAFPCMRGNRQVHVCWRSLHNHPLQVHACMHSRACVCACTSSSVKMVHMACDTQVVPSCNIAQRTRKHAQHMCFFALQCCVRICVMSHVHVRMSKLLLQACISSCKHSVESCRQHEQEESVYTLRSRINTHAHMH